MRAERRFIANLRNAATLCQAPNADTPTPAGV